MRAITGGRAADRDRVRGLVAESVRRALLEVTERGNYVIAELKRKHTEFNDRYFCGALGDADIELEYRPSSGRVGCCNAHITQTTGRVVKFNVHSVKIRFNTAYTDDEERINNTLLHEMCHQWVFEYCIDQKEFDPAYVQCIKDFVESMNADGGHGKDWLGIAAHISRKSGYNITRYSDSAEMTDEAKSAREAAASREKEVVVGTVSFGDGWFAFLTQKGYVPGLEGRYGDNVEWRWFTTRTAGLNRVRGWCTKTSIKNIFGMGDSPGEAVDTLRAALREYIGDADIVPMQPAGQTDYDTYVGLWFHPLSGDYCYAFKPTAELVRRLGCGKAHNRGLEGIICLGRVRSRYIYCGKSCNPIRGSYKFLKAASDRQDLEDWFGAVAGGVPPDLAKFLV